MVFGMLVVALDSSIDRRILWDALVDNVVFGTLENVSFDGRLSTEWAAKELFKGEVDVRLG